MAYNTLRFEEAAPHIGLITLNRPDRLNAISLEMLEELQVLFQRVETMESIWVVILTGAGRGFCSGADLKDTRKRSESAGPVRDAGSHLIQIQKKYAGSVMGMRRLGQPIIAAVNGVAAGGGMCLALASDIVIASRRASFIPSFINIGLSGGELGSSYFLPRAVGHIRAAEILLTGRTVDAEEAARIGLANVAVYYDKLLEAAMGTAGRLVEKGGTALRLTKESLNTNFDAASLMSAIEFENRTQSICTTTPEHLSAVARFQNRSKAKD
jgi:enoyl-CoA hydratase